MTERARAHTHTHTQSKYPFSSFCWKKDYKQLVTCSDPTTSFSKQRSGGSCTELQLFRWLLMMVIFVFFHTQLICMAFWYARNQKQNNSRQ